MLRQGVLVIGECSCSGRGTLLTTPATSFQTFWHITVPPQRLLATASQADSSSSSATTSLSKVTSNDSTSTATGDALMESSGGGSGAVSIVGTPKPPPRNRISIVDQCRPSADWNWEWVLKVAPGRKPAIQRPARHQWWFCNPNYDPNQPLPPKMLTPHAPPHAAETDDWTVYRRYLPTDKTLIPKYRRKFIHFLRVREMDWKRAFHRGLADDVNGIKKEFKREDEAKRQQAWSDYRDRLWAEALAPDAALSDGVNEEEDLIQRQRERRERQRAWYTEGQRYATAAAEEQAAAAEKASKEAATYKYTHTEVPVDKDVSSPTIKK